MVVVHPSATARAGVHPRQEARGGKGECRIRPGLVGVAGLAVRLGRTGRRAIEVLVRLREDRGLDRHLGELPAALVGRAETQIELERAAARAD